MKSVRTLVAVAALCVVGTNPAFAQSNVLQNGSFSSGLNGWNAFGDVTVVGPARRAVLSTASATENDDNLGEGFNNNSGTSPVDLLFADNLAGVPLTSLDTDPIDGPFATEGSAIRQSFNATAGDVVNVAFDWAFLSMETTPNDYAFVAINDTVVRFANTTGTQSSFAGEFGDFSVVNWVWSANNFRYTANASGLQSFVIGVVDMNDFQRTSELRIDNVSLQITPVPEPETYAMLLAGLALMGSIARRRRSS